MKASSMACSTSNEAEFASTDDVIARRILSAAVETGGCWLVLDWSVQFANATK